MHLYLLPINYAYVLAYEEGGVQRPGAEGFIEYRLLSEIEGVEFGCDPNERLASGILRRLSPGPLVVESCGRAVTVPSEGRGLLKMREGIRAIVIEPIAGSWARTPEEARTFYGDLVDGAETVDGGMLKGMPPTVVRVDGLVLTILREGAISASEVERVAIEEVSSWEAAGGSG